MAKKEWGVFRVNGEAVVVSLFPPDLPMRAVQHAIAKTLNHEFLGAYKTRKAARAKAALVPPLPTSRKDRSMLAMSRPRRLLD